MMRGAGRTVFAAMRQLIAGTFNVLGEDECSLGVSTSRPPTIGAGALFGMVELTLAAPLTSASVHIANELRDRGATSISWGP